MKKAAIMQMYDCRFLLQYVRFFNYFNRILKIFLKYFAHYKKMLYIYRRKDDFETLRCGGKLSTENV